MVLRERAFGGSAASVPNLRSSGVARGRCVRAGLAAGRDLRESMRLYNEAVICWELVNGAVGAENCCSRTSERQLKNSDSASTSRPGGHRFGDWGHSAAAITPSAARAPPLGIQADHEGQVGPRVAGCSIVLPAARCWCTESWRTVGLVKHFLQNVLILIGMKGVPIDCNAPGIAVLTR
jgi:hypothetical protein